jgi:hypothetical protein
VLAEKAGKQVFHQPKGIPIKFLGLFDTVSGPVDNDVMNGLNFRDVYPARGVEHIVHLLSMHEVRWEFTLKRFEVSTAPRRTLKTLREIWMPGVHSDVGGGYLENLISNIALLTMCDKLESLGGVAIDKSAYSEIESEIKSKIENRRLVINSERLKGSKQKRDDRILQEDEIHPLHWYLLNKTVIWKNDTPPTTYADRIGRPFEVKDRTLQSRFDTWVSEQEEPRQVKKPRARRRK